MDYIINKNELYHHGIKGQKWGIRRYQNEDGTLTEAGKKRYGSAGAEMLTAKSEYKKANKEYNKSFNRAYNKSYQSFSLSKKKREAGNERWEDAYDKADAVRAAKQKYKSAKEHARDIQVKENLQKAQSASQAEKALKQKLAHDYAKGETALGRIWRKTTGWDKTLAAASVNSLEKEIKKGYKSEYTKNYSKAKRAVARFLGTDRTYAELMFAMEGYEKLKKES